MRPSDDCDCANACLISLRQTNAIRGGAQKSTKGHCEGGEARHGRPKAAAGCGGDTTTQARPQENVHVHRRSPSQVWVPNHVAAIVLHARWDRGKKEGGGVWVCGSCRPCVGCDKKGKRRGWSACLPACLPAWKQTTTCLHTYTRTYMRGLQYTYNTYIHTCMHSCIHTLTYMRKPHPARPRVTVRVRERETVSSAGSSMPSKQTGNIDQPPGLGRVCPQ